MNHNAMLVDEVSYKNDTRYTFIYILLFNLDRIYSYQILFQINICGLSLFNDYWVYRIIFQTNLPFLLLIVKILMTTHVYSMWESVNEYHLWQQTPHHLLFTSLHILYLPIMKVVSLLVIFLYLLLTLT